MKIALYCLAAVLMLLPLESRAQELTLDGEIVSQPICFTLRNTADHSILGTFGTNYYIATDGTQARHRSDFRLDKAGSKDEQGYPSDSAEFCSYGPFFADRKLELTLKTLFPVFNCYTHIEKGEILIKSKRKADDSGNDIWAECL
jgi:hypothetical protein